MEPLYTLVRNAMACLRYNAYRMCHLRRLSTVSWAGLVGYGSTICILGRSARLSIGSRPIIGKYVDFETRGSLTIGDRLFINNYSRIISLDRIEIGNNVVLAQFVSILDHDHAYEMENGSLSLRGYNTAPIKVGNNVWIGDKCTVLKGVKIGDNVVIGANSLVSKDIPSNCVAVGNPCRVVKTL